MNPDGQDKFSTQPEKSLKVAIPSENLIAVLAVPTLLGLAGAKAAFPILESVGKSCEEVFRGARLPGLNFPKQMPEEQD